MMKWLFVWDADKYMYNDKSEAYTRVLRENEITLEEGFDEELRSEIFSMEIGDEIEVQGIRIIKLKDE